jgi:hypothetical protein
MRFEITYLEGNKVMVTDKVQKDNYYGQVVNGKAVADSELAMKKISKALREMKKAN